MRERICKIELTNHKTFYGDWWVNNRGKICKSRSKKSDK